MHLTRSKQRFEHLTVVDSTASTNDELRERAADAAHFSVVVTDHQTAGRGRLGRSWSTPAGQALAISVLVRPVVGGGEAGGGSAGRESASRGSSGAPIAADRIGWLPLIAGLAMTRAVASLLPGAPVGLKWPNDVQVRGLKISGILSELVDARLVDAGPVDPGVEAGAGAAADAGAGAGAETAGVAVIIGAGLNLAIPADELPTPVSTSLGLHDPTIDGAAASGDDVADAALLRYLEQLESLVTLYLEHRGDPESSGIRSAIVDACTTIGQQVRVQLPDASELLGTATGIDADGRLLVTAADGVAHAVAAGDVTHLRYA